MSLRYLSVCSGIEAASVAWHPLGFTPVAFSEIDEFASAVLKHRYPSVTNLGNMCDHKEWSFEHPIDLLVGGTPCQSFSVAGLRRGLDDPRGNLALVYLGIVDQFKPRWVVWENVPGVLTSNGGGDFNSFISGLVQLGYNCAYRVLDCQYFGLAQRRKRVFVVGHRGDWRGPAAVLFEPGCMRRDNPPSRQKGPEDTIRTEGSAGGSSWPATVTNTLTASFGAKKGLEYQHINNGCTWFVPGRDYIAATLRTKRPGESGRENDFTHILPSISYPLTSGLRMNTPDKETYVAEKQSNTMLVRRLSVIECERLQGFDDNYTCVPFRGKSEIFCPDTPRYRVVGNSMAVPVMRWIGRRITIADKIMSNHN